ncbi:ribonuclease HII [Pasteuria penetrans]|uniref:ribonuclease HII n=1 Tax=Pasteuria penetrans TaxID=86005 RepID=UPI001CAA5C75|nr:ribonuclease HII [Pasteuria penetrans]
MAWEACGYRGIAGVDEAGRGCWAGPVVAAAVVLYGGGGATMWKGLYDSKRLSSQQRQYWLGCIRSHACAVGIGWREVATIDRLGIVPATQGAMRDALSRLACSLQVVLVDGFYLPGIHYPQVPLVRGDQRSISIAAASIVAKTYRDTWMMHLDKQMPQYGFSSHKGYGTKQHRLALATHGLSYHHRRSFAPLRALLSSV